MFGFGKKGKDPSKPEDAAAAGDGAPDSAPEPIAPEPAPRPRPAPVDVGLMQERPVNLASILEHAAKNHGAQEIVTALIEGGMHRQTYAETLTRTKKLANALRRLGIQPGDRVATMAWNTHRHIEAWYAISGQGVICHTVNPRLFPEQIAYIVNHAQNRVVFVDLTFAPLVEKLRAHLPTVERYVVMTDRANMPPGDWLCYEDLIAAENDDFTWPSFPEETASSLCYTSGTTGEPKGVLYSHRSNLLMAYATSSKDVMNMGSGDVSLMVVPMFHANAWGMVYAVPMAGGKLILPGMSLDGASTHRLIKEERVTGSAAVPTVWSMLLQHLEKTGDNLEPLREVIIGGSAVPRAMFEVFDKKYGVTVIQGWGMTETSPVGTISRLLPKHAGLDYEAKLDIRVKQGRAIYGIELKIVDDAGAELQRDGRRSGRLLVRGPWVARAYFGRDETIVDADGWFDTGDVATIDADGIMQITDRAKDVIKSGGEWISSVDLENAAVAHPDVAMACAIGVHHPKWEERPLLLVVPKENAFPNAEAILEIIGRHFARWQLPDEIIFVDELPLTATGKLDKKVLREKYKNRLKDVVIEKDGAPNRR